MEIPSTLAPVVGLPTFVILMLLGILAMVIRALFNRKILPLAHHLEIVEHLKDEIADRDKVITEVSSDRDRWRNFAESISEQNAELLTNQDLTLTAWNSIKAYVAAKEREL